MDDDDDVHLPDDDMDVDEEASDDEYAEGPDYDSEEEQIQEIEPSAPAKKSSSSHAKGQSPANVEDATLDRDVARVQNLSSGRNRTRISDVFVALTSLYLNCSCLYCWRMPRLAEERIFDEFFFSFVSSHVRVLQLQSGSIRFW